nr:prenyltransferase [Rhodococcus sp. HNM0569]
MTAEQCLQTGLSIARAQEASGAIPWFPGGHVDPWDHVESAMALTVCGLVDEADAAYRWSQRTQRPDGSWPSRYEQGVVTDDSLDVNFCAYIAVGVWHHFAVTRDADFLADLWPTVRRALDFVLRFQRARGEFVWTDADDLDGVDALLTGNASIHHALCCGIAIADHLTQPQPGWELAAVRVAHAVEQHPDAFADKSEYSMDWYYPVLGGALTGAAARAHLAASWDRFVVPGLGARCVDHRPWVTGAETCELVMALVAAGMPERAREQFANMQHLRERDGSYWTGLVYDDGKRWPVECSTWTAGAMVLAADALSATTAGAEVFRADVLRATLLGDRSVTDRVR